MYIIEIFRKRRVFEPVFKKLWDRISPVLVYPVTVEQDPMQKLIYVGLIAYAAVFASATTAGMSSSAAHYLARMQMRQYKFDKPTGKAVEKLFSGTDAEHEKVYAQQLLQVMARVIAMDESGEDESALLMKELAQAYPPITSQV